MSDYEFTLPIYVTTGKKKKKKITLSLNWYRNVHYQVSNNVKQQYKEMIAEQFDGLIKPEGRIKVHYIFYARINNNPDLDNFVGCSKKFFQDAMVELGFIPDDNVHIICKNSEEYGGVDKKNPRMIAKITCLD